MSLRDKIIDYYKILLELGWLEADENGEVSLVIGDERMPATINGQRLIVPTIEQMKNYNWDDRIGFHPLRESYNLGISDVLANLRDQYVMRLNVSIAYLMKELVDIGYNVAGQKDLTTEQGQVLNALPHCNKNTVACFESLQKKTRAQNNADQFINIFIRKGGMVEGKTFGRAGIVTFPIYQKLVEGEEKINGVKISNKDREMFIALFRFIFPTIDNTDAYNVGVNTRTAPFLEALIRATFNVVDDLVEAAAPYMPIVSMPTILTFPKEIGIWKEIFEDRDLFERLAATIPNLSRGEEAVVEDKPARATSSSTSRSEPSRSRDPEPEAAAAPKPRGRMILGDASPAIGTFVGKSSAGRETSSSSNDRQVAQVTTGRTAARDVELDREAERRRREEDDRERRQREKEEEEDRRRRELRRKEDDEVERKRRELRDELDRLEGRGGRDRDDRGRDYDDRGRGRSRDRDDRDDRGSRSRTGDPFDDNPALRANLRDEEDRGRGRSRSDRDYDDRDGRRRGVRDIRDGGRDDRSRGRGRRDYYDDDRDYDPRDVRSRYRR